MKSPIEPSQNQVSDAGYDIADQLRAVAQWFTSQPPINLIGMMHADNRGDIVYTAIIKPQAQDACLLWNMIAIVEFSVAEFSVAEFEAK